MSEENVLNELVEEWDDETFKKKYPVFSKGGRIPIDKNTGKCWKIQKSRFYLIENIEKDLLNEIIKGKKEEKIL